MPKANNQNNNITISIEEEKETEKPLTPQMRPNIKVLPNLVVKEEKPLPSPTKTEKITRGDTEKRKTTKKKTMPMQKHEAIDTDKVCPYNWYGGIGIAKLIGPDGYTSTITSIFEGYAADRSGLRIGDIIRYYDDSDIRGTPGTPLTLTIERNGGIFKITLIRVRVCYTL